MERSPLYRHGFVLQVINELLDAANSEYGGDRQWQNSGGN